MLRRITNCYKPKWNGSLVQQVNVPPSSSLHCVFCDMLISICHLFSLLLQAHKLYSLQLTFTQKTCVCVCVCVQQATSVWQHLQHLRGKVFSFSLALECFSYVQQFSSSVGNAFHSKYFEILTALLLFWQIMGGFGVCVCVLIHFIAIRISESD